MVGAGEMNQADLAGVLQTIAQQQTAIFHQQAALLQVHNETVRLQRLRRAHARQPGRRRRSDTHAGDGVLPDTATVKWGRSVTFTCTAHAHASCNRNTSPFAAGGNLVADSGCGRTPGR